MVAEMRGFGISQDSGALVIVLIALVIAVLVAAIGRDMAYELVIIWAFVGISVTKARIIPSRT